MSSNAPASKRGLRVFAGISLVCTIGAAACGSDDAHEDRSSGNVDRGDEDASMGTQVDNGKEPMTRIPTFGNGPRDAGPNGAAEGDGGADASAEEPGPVGGFEIPSDGLVLLLRADRGLDVDTSGAVRWRDQSGHMHDATQDLPEYAPGPGGIADWQLPAVLFDGVDDHLELTAGYANFSKGVSLFSVAQFDEDQDCSPLFEASNGPEVNDLHLGRYEEKMLYEVADSYITAGAAPLHRTSQWSAIQDDEGTLQMRVDGSEVGTAEVPLPVTIKRGLVYLGKSLYQGCPTLNGGIAALIVYERALSHSEVLQVESALHSFAEPLGF